MRALALILLFPLAASAQQPHASQIINDVGITGNQCLGRNAGNTLWVGAACSAGSGAPTDAEYIVAEANATLSAEVAPGADDQVPVSDSATGVTWRAVPDCGEAGTLNYTAATNTFSCLTDGGGTLDSLTDVTLTAPATGATLIKGAGDWIDGQLDLADADAVTGVLPDANVAAALSRDAEAPAAGDITGSLSGSYQIGASAVGTAEIADANVTYAKVQDVSAISRLLGRGSAAGAGDVEEIVLGTNLSMAGTTLNAASGAGTNLTYTAATRLLESDTGTDVTLPLFTSTDAGLVPLSGGGTTNYLRADGTFNAPPGAGSGDNVTVDGAAATDANFRDSLYIDFTPSGASPTNIDASFNYTETQAGDPALGAEECVFSTEGTSNGAILCEGVVANTLEALYSFPQIGGGDPITNFVVDASSEVIDVEGPGLLSTGGVLGIITNEEFFLSTSTAPASLDRALVVDTNGDGVNILNDTVSFLIGAELWNIPTVREYPTADGQVLTHNATNDDWEWRAVVGGQNTEVQWNNNGVPEGSDRLTFAISTAGAAFGAGTTTAGTWPTLASGTVLTAAVDGTIEEDADTFYLTTDAGNRGVVSAVHLCRNDAAYALANSAVEQRAFNCSANGRLTLETGTYFFESMLYITGMNAASGNAAFGILGAGGATIGTVVYHVVGIDAATPTNAATQTGAFSILGQTVASMVTATVNTAMGASLRGTYEVTAAGTIVPSITLVTANAATMAAGTYFLTYRVGSVTAGAVGQWD